MFLRNHAAGRRARRARARRAGGASSGPWLYGIDPYRDGLGAASRRRGSEGFLLGTDYLGRDLFAGILARRAGLADRSAAPRRSCTVFIGITVGALAGFYRGWVEEVLMRVTEFFQVLPTLLFSMVIVVAVRRRRCR